MNTLIEFLIVILAVCVGGFLVAFLVRNMTRGGSAVNTSLYYGAVNETMTKDKQEAADEIIQQNAGIEKFVQGKSEPK
ncbi:MAG: hypothetical protein K9J12_02680 [Melioribacteraceae bacterium]|nr:hypothetical protein [Melioribacteraceae bacterium]